MSVNVDYHANFDTTFAPSVEFQEAHDCFGEHYRLKLNNYDVTIFATRKNLLDLMAAIAKGIQPEAVTIPVVEDEKSGAHTGYYNGSFYGGGVVKEDTIPVLQPVTAQVQLLTAPEFTGEVR